MDTLTDHHVTLIGCGQMGGAIIKGLVDKGAVSSERVTLIDTNEQARAALAADLGIHGPEPDAGDRPVIWLLAVKPHLIEHVIASRRDDMSARDTIVSVAAGVGLDTLCAGFEQSDVPHVLRAMPNTPCLVGAGVTGVLGTDEHATRLGDLVFGPLGRVVHLEQESLFSALTAISGSGPAYVFTILEAIADGGVLMGLPRPLARQLAQDTLAGAVELVRHSPEVHTAELKDRVASPGGTTIAALRELERGGLRHTLIAAVEAAAKKS